MKKITKTLTLLVLVNILHLCAYSQGGDEETKPDIFKTPSSPASSLLRFATTDIEKPSDLSAFMVSLQSATSSFSKLPSNYAVDISPYWLLRTKTDFTTTGLDKTKFKDVFKQTFVVSLGVRNVDSSFDDFKKTSTYGAIGFKFSIQRAPYCSEDLAILGKIHASQRELNSKILDNISKDRSIDSLKTVRNNIQQKMKEDYKNLSESERQNKIDSILSDPNSTLNKVHAQIAKLLTKNADDESLNDIKEKLGKAVKDFEGKRAGFSWDVAGGISTEFRNKNFNNSKVYNAGVWTTAGWTNDKGNFSYLTLLRYLYNPDKAFIKENKLPDTSNISNFDAGFRFVYSTPGNKGNISMEAMYRSSNAPGMLKSNTWRFMFNADYELWKNQKLTFSFGRDFDGTITKDGNLVAALTLITGLGNKKIDTPKSN